MGNVISPVAHMSEIRYPLRVSLVRPAKVELETKALEVIADILDAGISSVQRELGCKLYLDRGLHGGGSRRGAKLGALGVKVATKSLKMGAQKHHVALQAFL